MPQGRIGRSQPSTPKQIGSEMHISSSKYSILSTNKEEEEEIVEEGKEIIEEEGNVDVIEEILEEDKIEDGLLEKSRGKNKVMGQRGMKIQGLISLLVIKTKYGWVLLEYARI